MRLIGCTVDPQINHEARIDHDKSSAIELVRGERYRRGGWDRRRSSGDQYVLEQRLALACRGLRDPRLASHTVSSIAHDAGFGDLSYFNRTFRRRYGVTPSGAREPVPD
jgi:AraC-like DNA-binding protein